MMSAAISAAFASEVNMAKKKQQPQKPKYRFDYTCRKCGAKAAGDHDPVVCSSCESKFITVNDHKKIISTAKPMERKG